MAQGTFATAITCMDGRVQEPVARWIKDRLRVDYVDTVTEAGPDRVLIQGPLDGLDAIKQVESIQRKARLSVEAHGSRAIAIVGHHDCAGNPVSREQHIEQIRRCAKVAAAWGLGVRILGLWVNEQWAVEVVADIGAAG